MNNIKVIGFTGFLMSGKDTAFSLFNKIRPNTFFRFAFADALKNDLLPFVQHHFGFNITCCSAEQKAIVRGLMVEYGCAKRKVDADYWIKRLGNEVERIPAAYDSNLIPVITDVRFLNEAEYFKNKYGDGFKLVQVTRIDATHPIPVQELENQPKLKNLVDFEIRWPTVGVDRINDLAPHIKECYNNLFNK